MAVTSSADGTTHALIVAAGTGSRAGQGLPKQFVPVRGKPLVAHSVEFFAACEKIDTVWLVVGEAQLATVAAMNLPVASDHIVIGGATRQESVRNGLEAMATTSPPRNVLIHDAARPFLSSPVIDRLVDALGEDCGAIPVLPVTDSLVRFHDGRVEHPVDRSEIARVQTPQAFRFDAILQAHRAASRPDFTDDASILAAAGKDVVTVEGDEALKKFTTPQDFEQAGKKGVAAIRMGFGYDVHRLGPDEELWLGGVRIDHDRGLIGHSDADVLLHAITDALLGAMAAGDIGDHFPPDDAQWRGASSDHFLRFAMDMLRDRGGMLNNVDATLICEAPKIKPHRQIIRESIAQCLAIPTERVSVKATTTEGLGFTGRQEGIAAQAVVTIAME